MRMHNPPHPGELLRELWLTPTGCRSLPLPGNWVCAACRPRDAQPAARLLVATMSRL